MAIQEMNLTFESLEDLYDGRIAMVLKRHMAMVARDCMNRPGDKTKRKVTLEFGFTPVPDPDDMSVCERVDCQLECKSKLPVHRSRPIQMRPHETGFIFNQDFPEDISQQSLFNEDAEAEEGEK